MKKIVLYCGGGTMSGVFGAGVFTAFQEMNLYKKIKAIYAGSAGAINASYFLTKQVKLGASIYFDDLTNNFILPFNIPGGILQLFWNRYINRLHKINNVVNIDYIFEIIKYKKILNTKRLKKQSIKFYAKLLNTSNGKIEYFDVRKSKYPLGILKATISVKPYYFSSRNINGEEYIDGTIKEPIGLPYLLKKYPNEKIVVVINEPVSRGVRHYIKNFMEGSVASLYQYKINLFKLFIERERLVRNDIQLALSCSRVLIIHPPKNSPTVPRTTNYSKLITTYEMGKKEAMKIESFLKK